MDNLLNKEALFRLDGITVRGTVIKVNHLTITLRDDEGGKTIIAKNKIAFYCDKGDKGFPVLNMLACQNEGIKCSGVKFLKRGDVKDLDYEIFMKHCPVRNKDCKYGNLGDMLKVKPEIILEALNGTIFGDYPGDE